MTFLVKLRSLFTWQPQGDQKTNKQKNGTHVYGYKITTVQQNKLGYALCKTYDTYSRKL